MYSNIRSIIFNSLVLLQHLSLLFFCFSLTIYQIAIINILKIQKLKSVGGQLTIAVEVIAVEVIAVETIAVEAITVETIAVEAITVEAITVHPGGVNQ